MEKLGELTLADKVKQATEASDDPEVQAHLLKESLTGAENSQLHGKVLSVSKGEGGTELQNVSCCTQGPGETGETWTYPSMVLVPLCTAMVMAWSLQGELGFCLATFHYHSTTRLLGAKAKALVPTGSL